MQISEPIIDLSRCGGGLWDKLDDHDWARYCQGHVVPQPIESMWCLSPTRTAVHVQSGSLESIICICANYDQWGRIDRLLTDPRLDESDIHPSARADVCIYKGDRHGLAGILMRSAAARLYVCSLNPAFTNLDIVEWAQDFCISIETQKPIPLLR